MSRVIPRRGFLLAAGAGLFAVRSARAAGFDRAEPPLLKAAINGGRARGSHPALPTTPEECARDAAAVVLAGAGAIHVHVRNFDGVQSVASEDVAAVLTAIRGAAPETTIGVSTQLGIVGDAAKRHALVAGWSVLPDFASVNFDEEGSVGLAMLLISRGVGIEAGLPDAAATRTCVESGLARQCLRIMMEPRQSELGAAIQNVNEMAAALDAAGNDRPRLLHGFRTMSWPLIEEAARRGHQTRAGLEDTLEMPDGTQARDNAEIVAEAVKRMAAVSK
jgi:uncharacterized protein (DUF849 family)